MQAEYTATNTLEALDRIKETLKAEAEEAKALKDAKALARAEKVKARGRRKAAEDTSDSDEGDVGGGGGGTGNAGEGEGEGAAKEPKQQRPPTLKNYYIWDKVIRLTAAMLSSKLSLPTNIPHRALGVASSIAEARQIKDFYYNVMKPIPLQGQVRKNRFAQWELSSRRIALQSFPPSPVRSSPVCRSPC